jgi:hypothetical protein
MHIRALLAAPAMVVAALSCSGIALADDPFEWPELPYEPCFRVERVLTSTEICSQGGSAFGRAINAHGTIVGEASCGLGPSRAFIWRMNQPFQWIPTPTGTSSSWARAINDDGWVVGRLSGGSASGNGFAWHEGTGEFHLIASPFGGGAILPRGINAEGVIVGDLTVLNQPGVTPLQGFIWQAGKLTRLEELYDLGGRVHVPTAIDDRGTITGYFLGGDGGTAAARPFLIKDGTLHEFDPFPDGWNGTVPGALLHDGVFLSESWENPDMPQIKVAAYGNESGFMGQVETSKSYRRVAPLSGNAFGDAVGARMDLNGVSETIVIRRGVLHVLRGLTVGPQHGDVGVAYGISSNGQITSALRHLVPAPPPLGDLSHNCRRDLDDLPLMLAQWGPGGSPADLNGDERVDIQDLLILLRLITDDQSF